MKILSVSQIRQADAYTIEHEPVSSSDLMERASSAFSNWFARCFSLPQTVVIFCGTGNNGGDGLCIARQLTARGYNACVYAVWFNNKPTPDFLLNLKRLEQHNINVSHLHANTPLPVIEPGNIVIDALFGSGLTRPITDLLSAALIQHINNNNAYAVVAVDMPSGLFADVHTPDNTNIVKATHTLSFELPKLAFMLPQNASFVGHWHTVSIGLHPLFIAQATTNYHYLSHDLAAKWQREIPKNKFAHKGTRGHALVIGGSYGKIGACLLTAKAALHKGAGLVTAYLPTCGYEIVQTAAPEIMLICDPNPHYITQLPDIARYQAIAVGTGLDTQTSTHSVLLNLLKTANKLVIDADALNIIAQNNWQNYLPPNSILTPHPKEFERLVGSTSNHFERLEKLQQFAQQHQIVVVLKGAHTAIALPTGEVYFNSTGNPAMATAGSGDVLTGFIVALLAQGYTAPHAAMLGVYLHGQAGDQSAKAKNNQIVASDMLKW